MMQHLKVLVAEPLLNVALAAREVVVHHEHLVTEAYIFQSALIFLWGVVEYGVTRIKEGSV